MEKKARSVLCTAGGSRNGGNGFLLYTHRSLSVGCSRSLIKYILIIEFNFFCSFYFELILSHIYAELKHLCPFPNIAVVSVGYPNAQNPVAAYGGWLEAEYNEATGELLRPPKGSFPELEEEEEKRELKAKERERNRLAQQEYRKRAKTFSCKFYIGGNTYCLDDDCC